MKLSSRFLVATGIAMAAFCGSTTARADAVGGDVVSAAVAIFGHGTLLPSYCSIGYYAYNSDRPMAPAWALVNVTTSVIGLSVGTVVTIRSIPGVAQNNERIAKIMASGLSLVAGSGLVAVATVMQATRDKKPQTAWKLPIVVPYGGHDKASGTTAGLLAIGSF